MTHWTDTLKDKMASLQQTLKREWDTTAAARGGPYRNEASRAVHQLADARDQIIDRVAVGEMTEEEGARLIGELTASDVDPSSVAWSSSPLWKGRHTARAKDEPRER